MQRGQVGVRRVTATRNREPLVRCTFGEIDDRIHNRYGSCGAMIPYKPRRPCPECGQKQLQALCGEPPNAAAVINDDVALVDADTGEVVALQVKVGTDLANRLADSFRSLHWDSPVNARNKASNEGRLSGVVVTHRTFGFAPPKPLRRRWGCGATRLENEHPHVADLIAEYCTLAEHVLRTQAPDAYRHTAEAVGGVISPAWRIAQTPWTSGIINHTAAYPYHRDSGNVPGSWSAMLAARRNVGGGALHLADYDVWLGVPNGSITIFDGQSVLHGVQPLRFTHPNSYRFTVVAYAKTGLRVCCDDPKDEAKRAALVATEAAERASRR